MSLKSVIEDQDTRAGRVFDAFIFGVIGLAMVSFSIETFPDLSPRTQGLLVWCERITVVIFTIEYVLRVAVATSKRKYIFSFYGIIDLLAILPFYLGAFVDLRAIRAFRLLRLFRALKLMRYSRAIQRFQRAFEIAREEIVLFVALACVLLFFAAVGIWQFEHEAQPETFKSLPHSLWWAIVTLTTVGYGDAYPVTVGGRIFTFLILMVGLGIVAVPAGLLASALSKARAEEDIDKKK